MMRFLFLSAFFGSLLLSVSGFAKKERDEILYPQPKRFIVDLNANAEWGGGRWLYGVGGEIGAFYSFWTSRQYYSSNVHRVGFGLRAGYNQGLTDPQLKEDLKQDVKGTFTNIQFLLRYTSPQNNQKIYSFLEAGYMYQLAAWETELTEEAMRQLKFFPGNTDHMFRAMTGVGYSIGSVFSFYVAGSLQSNKRHSEGKAHLGLALEWD